MTRCIIRKSYHCVIFVNTQLIQWVTNELRCSKWNKLLDTLHVLIAAPDIKSSSHTKQGGRGSPSPHHSPLWGPEFPLPPSKFFFLFFFLFIFFVYFCCCCFLLFCFFFSFLRCGHPPRKWLVVVSSHGIFLTHKTFKLLFFCLLQFGATRKKSLPHHTISNRSSTYSQPNH